MPLTSVLNLVLDGNYTKVLDLTTVVDRLNKTYNFQFSDGIGTNQCDQQFHDKRTLAAGATDNLDLAGGLTDAFGTVLTFAKIKMLFIKNLSTVQTLTIGAGTAGFVGPFGALAHTLSIKPGGIIILILDPVGYTVTPTTADILKILNGATNSCDYEIIIWGTSS